MYVGWGGVKCLNSCMQLAADLLSLALVLVGVFVAVMKNHDQKQLGEEGFVSF